MSLATAIKAAMRARGFRAAEVTNRMTAGDDNPNDRVAFYRLLNGATPEPRLWTFINLCTALGVSPTELMQMAEMWPYHERPTDPLDLELRAVFAHMLVLPVAEKGRVTALVAHVAEAYSMHSANDENDERATPPTS